MMVLKRYSDRRPKVFMWIIVPYNVSLNALIFGACTFSAVSSFLKSFFFTGICIAAAYFLFGIVANIIQKRFPGAGDMFRRIAVMLPVFYILNALVISGIFYLYEQVPLMHCAVKPEMQIWSIAYGCAMSTIITFINEGVKNWDAWKQSITDNERLKNAYQRSKVLGLRGQINPHFLFNCFNTLSGLIQEDEVKAEKFLNEMTKVHRYLLKSDDELLVPLGMEIRFAESYLYLAKERFGDSVHFSIDIDEDTLQKNLPPLSLQVILENIIYSNALSKTNPLAINISGSGENDLMIVNTIHEKTVVQHYNPDDGLDNLLNKYRMLNTDGIVISEKGNKRILSLPLFNKKEVTI